MVKKVVSWNSLFIYCMFIPLISGITLVICSLFSVRFALFWFIVISRLKCLFSVHLAVLWWDCLCFLFLIGHVLSSSPPIGLLPACFLTRGDLSRTDWISWCRDKSPTNVSPNEVNGILTPLYDMFPWRQVSCILCPLDDTSLTDVSRLVEIYLTRTWTTSSTPGLPPNSTVPT